ncbi:phosphate regulon sensor histidine kinase PhoR [Methylococcus sp. EFPC2]|uniref:phosphate regulon sensor histidine kinase PhoR n=1 Tax=Methylococcus sp. EFPC2 TaxID=2812648 RepID=UPI001968610B|nr:phosphate regulon sensor histidine kinase PhoR [Methylococcus sp. EFPC2]QSA96878.1 phosphate regulon sensor histidine kinase PhoR [Methylococcus sp. EFPC2]
MLSPWRSELYWISWLGLVAAFFGKLTGQYFLAFWLASLIYLARHLFHINGLLVWLRLGGKVPSGGGIWEEIYYLIYRLRRRNKRRKKRLIVMLERFRTATAALPDATVVLGPRDEIEWFNEAAGELLGLQRYDIGQQIANLLRAPKFAEFLRACDYDNTVSVPAPGTDNRQLEIRVVPYGDDLRLLVAQDITQLRLMERVRSDFVANVSHELRTPLTVLKGYMETLTDEAQVSERHLKIFRRMEEQTERMQNLVDGLLSLTRLESGAQSSPQEVNVAALLRSLTEEVSLLQGPQPNLELLIETDARLSGSETELRSAFSNLVVNALKYTPAAGHVQVIWHDDGEGARLDVRDDGPGIAAEHVSRITERFYRVESADVPRRNGAGLGLSIVKHVLSRHDARLEIVSKPGEGSCFSAIFPARRVSRSAKITA